MDWLLQWGTEREGVTRRQRSESLEKPWSSATYQLHRSSVAPFAQALNHVNGVRLFESDSQKNDCLPTMLKRGDRGLRRRKAQRLDTKFAETYAGLLAFFHFLTIVVTRGLASSSDLGSHSSNVHWDDRALRRCFVRAAQQSTRHGRSQNQAMPIAVDSKDRESAPKLSREPAG